MQKFLLTYRSDELTVNYRGFREYDEEDRFEYMTHVISAPNYESAMDAAYSFLDNEAAYHGVCWWVSLEPLRRYARNELLAFIARIDSLDRAYIAKDFILKLSIPRSEKSELLDIVGRAIDLYR